MKSRIAKKCQACGHEIPIGKEYISKPYGDYCQSCVEKWPRTRLQFLVNCLVLLSVLSLTACASAPQKLVKATHYLRGCTAAMTTAGSLLYERVVVVGITPQGSTYWVYYPDRVTREPEGKKAYAEALPVERFIEQGKNGHAGNRPCRCPDVLWSPLGVSASQ